MSNRSRTTRIIRRLFGANAALAWEALRQRARQGRRDGR